MIRLAHTIRHPTTAGRRGGRLWRTFWVAVWLAVLLTTLVLAQQSVLLTILVLAALALVGLVWWWRRSAEGAGIAVSLALTMAVTAQTTYWVGSRLDQASPQQLGLAYWIFATVVALTTWLAPRRGGRRAATVALGHACLAVSSIGTYLAPSVVPVAGFAAAMLVVYARTRRRRPPRRTTTNGTATEPSDSTGTDSTGTDTTATESTDTTGTTSANTAPGTAAPHMATSGAAASGTAASGAAASGAAASGAAASGAAVSADAGASATAAPSPGASSGAGTTARRGRPERTAPPGQEGTPAEPTGRRLTRSQAAPRTVGELERLDDTWMVLTDRRSPSSGTRLAALVVGPPGVYVVETKAWSGTVAQRQITRHGRRVSAYALDGDVDALGAALRPVVDRTLEVSDELRRGAPPAHAVVVFWDRTELPQPVVDLSVYGTDSDGERAQVEITLLRGDALLDWLRERPVPTPSPPMADRLRAAARPSVVRRAVVRRGRGPAARPHQGTPDREARERLERAFPPR